MRKKGPGKNVITVKEMSLRGLAIFGIATCLVLLLSTFYATLMQDRFHRGISVSGVGIGGKTQLEARQAVSRKIEEFSSKLILMNGEKAHSASAGHLGISLLLDNALEESFELGHRGGLWRDMQEIASLNRFPQDFALHAEFNDEMMDAYLLREFSDTLEHPAVDARIDYDGKNIVLAPSKAGNIIDRTLLKAAINERLLTLDARPISLTTTPADPSITTQDVLAVKKELERTLATAPYFLFGNDKRFSISRDVLSTWIYIASERGKKPGVGFNQELIVSYLQSIAPALSREAKDAELGYDEEFIATILRPSQDALRLNVPMTAEQISEALKNMKRNIAVTLDATNAPINEKYLKDLGIRHLVGSGQSNFSGSPRARMQNIRVGAEKYRGLLVAAGEEFSFNAHLGEIDAKNGFVPELVIKDGKLIPEYGGGICQVSTTLFRSAVFAGLKVTQRSNHSIPVRYYGSPGFDATIYPPSPDFKFINTTSSTLYIQPRIEGTKITFELYGVRDSRTVTVEGPKVTESRTDGSIKTVVTQSVFRDGELIQKKSFWSVYKSPALYKIERNPLE